MNLQNAVALVTGGASGLGFGAASALAAAGARVVVADLDDVRGPEAAATLGDSGWFVRMDVTDAASVASAVDFATECGVLRVLVHCAGRGGAGRIVDREGEPGSLELFESVVRVNLVGTFNVLRLAAARMSRNEPADGERGVCVLTASIAAFDGQAGQAAYTSSKAGVVGMTLVAARDLAPHAIRVCTIAPGPFDTAMLAELPTERRQALADAVPHPRRLGRPAEYGALARHIAENAMLNGEVIRLDGAMRMAAR